MTCSSNRRCRAPRVAAVALGTLLLGACAAGPDYRGPPKVDTGHGWTQPDTAAPAPASLPTWWTTLGDPTLERLVATALADNLDLRQAQARIAEERALRDRTAGGHAPTVGAGASVTRRRQSKNGPLPIGAIPGLARDQTIHDAGFDAAWEIDLFGATRRAVEGAEARLQAAQDDAAGVRISIAAEVARSYLSLRGAQRELAAREASVQALAQTADLVGQRFRAGDAAQADVDAAQARLDAASAGLPAIQARARAAALGLGVLLGAPPERELALLDTAAAPITLAPIPVGQRADILRRRPDVRAAERRLAARTADIGVATAELFPKLSIGASGGFQALDASQLFDSASQRFSLMPLISWRVFDGGRVRAEIRASEAREQQAALAYEKAVLTALGDAERALGDYRLGVEAVRLQRTALDAARRSYAHAQARYAAGDIALTDLLAEERVLRDAEDGYARTHTAAAIDLVALFKALGGGWDADAGDADTRGQEKVGARSPARQEQPPHG
ncbi:MULTISPECIES: efflux transporter outer membrane subunit [Rhodanobacter]|uniref:Efflux transporter, outer membrane factor lipoprotein, NodT family n=1 Tax=Rhodanobacter denitrificans TaxID=666685 RepID=M4NJK8_9GAMM|nr:MULTISPECIES: efflux transporter outer membrane subunit [Rhodanobacter]AGG89873.1 efflux transporter, outer membrane factor lipoprotein, NodT family [Rhodanobacter denitrificans]UJM85269.1 efflux transporter outer membrane subunit [Rhodanobacter denitrificans]